jgi:hypothetical protein
MNTEPLTIYEACEKGDFEIIQNFLNSDEAKSNNQISSYIMTINAIKGGHLDILKLLWNSSFKNEENFDRYHLDTYAQQVCIYDRFDILKFMLDHPALIKNKGNDFMDKLPRYVASYGRLDMFKYLVENFPNDSGLMDNIKQGDILIKASRNGHLNIVDYLFTNDEIKDYIDIHLYNDEAFKVIYDDNQLDVLKYFIFNLNIEKTQDIIAHIKNDPQILKMFNSRDLNASLHQELDDNTKNIKKIKI